MTVRRAQVRIDITGNATRNGRQLAGTFRTLGRAMQDIERGTRRLNRAVRTMSRIGDQSEQAARGVCSPSRWQEFEAGAALPMMVEIDLICARLGESSDYILRGVERANIPPTERERQVLHDRDISQFSDIRKCGRNR